MPPPVAGLHVFRDARRDLAGPAMLADLARALEGLAGGGAKERRARALEALLRAGELECGLADVAAAEPEGGAGADPVGAGAAARVTDALASALLGDGEPLAGVPAHLSGIQPPARLRVSPPEGFAYYALHPLDFACLAGELPVPSATAGVIGVRSIGTTLSAVVAAALRGRGVAVDRLTVRPGGHPCDRRLDLAAEGRRRVRAWVAAGAELFVVDEGPGLSGSTLLSVGEALVAEGAPAERVTLLCTRAPDPDQLTGPDAARRARGFRWRAVAAPSRIPADAGAFLGGGAWRRHVYADASRWPACWPTFERLKYLSRDGGRLHKFEGLGHHGAGVQRRARLLSDAGLGPPPRDEGDGFASYPWLTGRPLDPADLSPAVIHFLGDYCAFRAAELPAPAPDGALEAAVREDLAAFARNPPADLSLAVERPVLPDARMLPHEFIAPPAGPLLKVDAASHGDDHFLPGPIDIAWDLASAVVEWHMGTAARRALLERYRRASGDDAAPRLRHYIIAYTSLRLAMVQMAAAMLQGSDESPRLERDLHRYRATLDAELRVLPTRR